MDPKPNTSQQSRDSIPKGFGYGGESEEQEVTTSTDELDDLASDMDGETPTDDLDRDLGWGSEEEEEIEEESTEEEEVADEQEESDDETQESDESDELEAEGEQEEEPAGEGEETDEEEGDEPFYDAERDFPGEKVQPSKYKDRVALNSGVAAKVNHSRELLNKLEEMEKGVGAIELPEIFEGNEEFVKNPFDRENFSNLDADQAKKAAFELDKFISDVKNKVDRVESEYTVAQEKEQVTEQYQDALNNVTEALDKTGIPVQEATNLTQRQILSRVDKAIEDYKENTFDEVYTEKGIDAANAGLRELEQAKETITEFPEISEKYHDVANKEPAQPQVTEEQTKEAFQELAEDRPDLPMFNGETDAEKRDFLEYARLKVQKGQADVPGTSRDWLNLYKQHQSDRKKEYERYKSSKKKSTADDKKAGKQTSSKKKKKNPPVSKIRSSKFDRNELSTEDVDNTLDDLASEMDASN